MKSLWLALFLALLGLAPAQAQTNFTMPPPAGVTVGGFQVVTSCGTGSLLTTQPAFGTIDITGKFCTNAGSGTVSGTASNATSGVAISSTNVPTVSYTYVWNGTTWDQWSSTTAGGVHFGMVGVVDTTGAQLNGYTTGTAGSPSTQVLSVQGVASGTPVPVNAASAATGGATYAHVAAGQATTVIKASAGTLYSICLNSAATATNTTNVYDNASTSGTIIATVAATTATVPTCLQYGPYGIAVANGIVIITATANGADMTVAFK